MLETVLDMSDLLLFDLCFDIPLKPRDFVRKALKILIEEELFEYEKDDQERDTSPKAQFKGHGLGRILNARILPKDKGERHCQIEQCLQYRADYSACCFFHGAPRQSKLTIDGFSAPFSCGFAGSSTIFIGSFLGSSTCGVSSGNSSTCACNLALSSSVMILDRR